jgi:hypothetical protein
LAETAVFLSHFNEVRAPASRARVSYPLVEILLLRLLAVLARAETFVD